MPLDPMGQNGANVGVKQVPEMEYERGRGKSPREAADDAGGHETADGDEVE